jgi:hypothetical protein
MGHTLLKQKVLELSVAVGLIVGAGDGAVMGVAVDIMTTQFISCRQIGLPARVCDSLH